MGHQLTKLGQYNVLTNGEYLCVSHHGDDNHYPSPDPEHNS